MANKRNVQKVKVFSCDLRRLHGVLSSNEWGGGGGGVEMQRCKPFLTYVCTLNQGVAREGGSVSTMQEADALEVLEALGVGSAVGEGSRRPLISHHIKNLPQVYPHLHFYFPAGVPLTLAKLIKAPEVLIRVRDETAKRKITNFE